ncbi:MAG: PD-(D/E)XK nuclease family protein [Cytophagales bacterium]|nr:MAG: PD-(D/E)XK nuclease family protein [Cytophagales bacterium]
MQSFLEQVADDLAQKYAQDISKFCILMPTKRSGLVFRNILEKKGFAQIPFIYAIDDFVPLVLNTSYTGQVTLLLELYDTFRSLEPLTTLDKFSAWGYVLLKDFDQIDRNLIDAKELFTNLYDIQNIKRWGLQEHQITIKMGRYFKLWENLHQTYIAFQEKLKAQKQGYAGMLYRQLAEEVEKYLMESKRYKHFVFIGFNALSKSEELIFKKLWDAKKADIYWDSDDYYMMPDDENKTGMFLLQYKNSWIGKKNWKTQGRALLEDTKTMLTISTPNAALQGKIANQLLKNWQFDPQGTEKTVIVLADENILVSVLYALDAQYKGLNITMGVSLKSSALFALIDTFFDLHQYTKKLKENDKWIKKLSYKFIIKIAGHIFLRSYENRYLAQTEGAGKSFLQAIINYINKNSHFFMTPEELLNLEQLPEFCQNYEEEELKQLQEVATSLKPLFELLFKGWKNAPELLFKLENLIQLIRPEEEIEKEYFAQFELIIQDLKNTLNGLKTQKPALYRQMNSRNFKIFLYQAIRQEIIAFDSDRESPLQIMGIAETKALDFDNVIVLSVNEDTLPKNKKLNSFIPLDIARHYELPTYVEQDAMVSYNFHRLLQRAKKIAMVYVNPSNTYGASEKSRFIHQIENDLLKKNPYINYENLKSRFKQITQDFTPELKIEKNKKNKAKIIDLLRAGISPAHINTYVKCSLKFYFTQIAELKDTYILDEALGADKFGTIIHEILEEMFRRIAERNKGYVNKEDLEAELPLIEEVVTEKFKKGEYANYSLTGENYITKEIAAEFIKRFLEAQIKEIEQAGMPFEIIVLENVESTEERPIEGKKPKIASYFFMDIEGKNTKVSIAGIIDRIDRIGNETRIIDYKTGLVKESDLKLKNEDLDDLIDDGEIDKLRQLWIYKYILAKKIVEKGYIDLGKHTIENTEKITAGIYSLRDNEKMLLKLDDNTKKDDKKILSNDDLKEFVEFSEIYLSKIINNMLSNQPFEKTDDVEICQYCTFRDICGR